MTQLFKAYTLFEKDTEYVVMDNKVMIVDEQTGRIMDGRRYSDGLHQAIEAKENVKIEAATQTFATVTLQNYLHVPQTLWHDWNSSYRGRRILGNLQIRCGRNPYQSTHSTERSR